MLARIMVSMVAVFLLCSVQLTLADQPRIGFLVVAPDRGYLGNQEVTRLVDDFRKSYPAALAFVGRDAAGGLDEYGVYLTRAIDALRKFHVAEIVAIPLFLSDADPLLRRVVPDLGRYTGDLPVQWASTMAHDHLIRQIVLDRVETLSQHPESERLILVGVGATDEQSESNLKGDIDRLLRYIERYKPFRETEAVVYYDRAAEHAEQKNQAAKARLLNQAPKDGRTLLVPAFIGSKYDHTMSLTAWFTRQFKQTQIVYQPDELLPHPNVLLWLRKTANRYTPVTASDIGVIVMPHGASQPYNDAVENVIRPLTASYPVEMAYGMGDPLIIQSAVSRLEERGIRRIIFVRMYALDHQVKPVTDYVIGLIDQPPAMRHDGDHGTHAPAPIQIRTSALFSSVGGYEHDPAMASIHHKRILELSRQPANESVFLVAHGESTDEGNTKWLDLMDQHIARLRQDPHCAQLKSIKALTVREDWPEKRDKAVAEARTAIEEAGKQGRVIVIANRLYGAGPYRRMFEGLAYEMNDKGLLDPLLTEWLEREVARISADILKSASGRSPNTK
ncbi:hypothetical protein W02_32830 [Nitrospira sp. KM1]|uniref:sirohydrochlorin chelatase n=1 Tax=Nitrospira sp. KM1 TaxID=1936990 RepID=UPI0013A73F78|nr:hypothetical protein [Nitrospira sp. KM1]BCA56143.1 hypothetical protein W02_32830 [Nitrospira sp. KM1]